MIKPFSSALGAMKWYSDNCDECINAYRPNATEDNPDFVRSEKLVTEGRECPLKYGLDLSLITGELPEYIAAQIGFNKQMPQTCFKFKAMDDQDNEGLNNGDPSGMPGGPITMRGVI